MENNSYAGSTEFDYPSISQIITKIREREINVIFAVLPRNSVKELYQTLASLEPRFSSTIELKDDASTDVSTLVQKQYNVKYRSTVCLYIYWYP